MKKIVFTFSLLVMTIALQAQVLIDDTATPNTEPEESAVLELRSEDKGLLLPRLSTAPSNPVDGLVYYDTSGKCIRGYSNNDWQVIGAACDFPVPVDYTISISDASSVVEGELQTFTVTISPVVASGHEIEIDFITIEDTATEGSDYTGASGTLTFSAGEDSQDITITTTNDTEEESDEVYNVLIDNPQFITGSGSFTLSSDTASGTITDDDTVSSAIEIINIPEANIQDEWDTHFTNTSGYVNNDYGGVRLGSGSNGGVMTYNDPITFSGSTGTVIVTIDVKGWDSNEKSGRINVGSQTHDFTVSVDKNSPTAETVTHTFTNVPTNANVSFESTGGDSRFIIYSILIEKED